MRRDVFQAVADPTRREIIHLLAQKKMNLNEVAGRFEISRPAISRHIKILTECGLVTISQEGRERYCSARLQELAEIAQWLSAYKQFWESKLDSLETYLETVRQKPKIRNHGKRKK